MVLYAGRLGIEKGIDALLAAWPRVPDRASMRLVIVGHGPLQGRVDAFVAAHDEVRAVGYLDGPAKVAEAMASADVFVSLGAFETFSLTTLEALAAGAVVVAPSAGGAGELARHAGMPTCDVSDADALAAAIATAAARSGAASRGSGASFAAAMTWDAAFDRMTCYQQQVLDAWRRDDVASLEPPGPWHPIAPRDDV